MRWNQEWKNIAGPKILFDLLYLQILAACLSLPIAKSCTLHFVF